MLALIILLFLDQHYIRIELPTGEENDAEEVPNGEERDAETILTSPMLKIEKNDAEAIPTDYKENFDGMTLAYTILTEEENDAEAIPTEEECDAEAILTLPMLKINPVHPLLDLLASQYPPPSGQWVTP